MGLDELKDKAKDILGQHADQADKGIDKAREIIDDKTAGKYTEQLTSASDKAKETYRDNQQ
jgi:MT0933-like antitoxin protein